jgi:hypothetical protein
MGIHSTGRDAPSTTATALDPRAEARRLGGDWSAILALRAAVVVTWRTPARPDRTGTA